MAAPYGMFRAHVVVAGERIAGFTADDGVLAGAGEVIDATGLVVLPGSIDLHGHFEDPGHTEREDFHAGTMAAAADGVTSTRGRTPGRSRSSPSATRKAAGSATATSAAGRSAA